MTKGASVITMTYTADGEKLTKAVTGGGATKNYVGGIEYSGASLEAIYHGEGRCTPNGATAFFYEYTVKDHLGIPGQRRCHRQLGRPRLRKTSGAGSSCKPWDAAVCLPRVKTPMGGVGRWWETKRGESDLGFSLIVYDAEIFNSIILQRVFVPGYGIFA